MAQDGIQSLLEAGLSFRRVAEAYAATAVKLVLAHAGREDAQDLLVSLHMMLDTYEEANRHGRARS